MALIRDYYDPHLPTLSFSLHPQPTRALVAGTKLLEFRRRFYAQAFQAFVYTTGRRGGVGTYVQCAPAVIATPAIIGQLGARLQGDDPQAIQNYLALAEKGLAIPVTTVITFEPLPLATLKAQFSNFVAPRNYVFLNRPERQAQLDYLLGQPCQSVHQRGQLMTDLKKVKAEFI